MNNLITCELCPHYCKLSEGSIGFCGARQAKLGKVRPLNYGKITCLALDPIEKKPLHYYHPKSMILSVGSFGCNMACPFCQNYHIAVRSRELVSVEDITSKQLITIAQHERKRGNIGIAFTYNEPLIAFEFILDTARLAQAEDLKIVIVSNGQINEPYLKELLPYVSAWSIDLKAFSEETYHKLGGDFKTVLRTIELTQEKSHVEITTLIVPGISDNDNELREESKFLASIDPNMPLHLSRYFPSHKYIEPATDIAKMLKLKEISNKYLNRVRLGNI